MFFSLYIYMYEYIACIYVLYHICAGPGGPQKKCWIPLELELQKAVNHHMVLRIKPRSSERPVSALNC